MNGKKCRLLRKQAGGNEAEYLTAYNHRNSTSSLTHRCSRRKYRDLKVLYRLVGV